MILIERIPRSSAAGSFIKAVKYFTIAFREFDRNITPSEKIKKYSEYIEYYMAIEAYLKANNYRFDSLNIREGKQENIDQIRVFYVKVDNEFEKLLTLDYHEETRVKYSMLFGKAFCYEFSEGDVDRVQQLIIELREMISKSELFTAEHQQRLLKRLERLQGELHKKVSDLDRFWGLIGDAGVAIGKFGKDAKPFVDRIKEIADIVWRTQARKEELPSGTSIPFLSDGKDNTGK